MQSAQATSNTVLDAVISRHVESDLLSRIAPVVLGALFITVCAKIQVPVWPVPVTLQGFAVASIAAAFGARIGLATVGFYLLQGAVGLPVFAGGGGAAYFTGPTAGFLVGFMLMALIIGAAADRGACRRPVALFGSMLAGNTALLAIGYIWLLAMSVGAPWLDQNDVVASAFHGAIQPFIVWDLLKMALATASVAGLWKATTSR